MTRNLFLAFIFTAPALTAQAPIPAQAWAARAAEQQVDDLAPTSHYLRFQIHSKDTKGNLIRDLIESTDGPVARLIFKENRPLTAAENAAELDRLNAMLASPDAFAKHTRSDRSVRKQAADVVRLIPKAMIFTYDAAQPAHQVLLDFHPDPAWQPPTMASELLTGLQGKVWLDSESGHLLRLETNVFRPVNVGFGIFARLFPGGTVTVDQAPAPDGRWLVSHFSEHLTLRALMVKTYKENGDVQVSHVAPIEALTYPQAIARLLATSLPTTAP